MINRNSIIEVAQAIENSFSENEIKNLYRQLQVLVRDKMKELENDEYSFLNGEYISFTQSGVTFFGQVLNAYTKGNKVAVKFNNLYELSNVTKKVSRECLLTLQVKFVKNYIKRIDSSDYCNKLQEWYDKKDCV